MALGLALGTAIMVSHADDVSAEVNDAALAAAVDPQQLQGALNSLKTAGLSDDPYTYLRSTGELPPLREPVTPPPPVTARVDCIENKESGGANIANAHGSGAGGVLQYMPSTFARGAAEMGHPEWSLWNPAEARAVAAHDLALGRRGQWSVGGC
jgi:hypothetical protein